MAALKTSPLAPPGFPELPEVAGVRLAAVEANIHYRGRNDVMLAAFDAGTRVAGVLTRSLTASAPVHWCRERLPQGCASALIVCAGNANAFTGQTGYRHVRETCEAVGAQLGCSPDEVFVASTGVIGDTLPIGRVLDAVPVAAAGLGGNWESAARAIMTTDTFPKGATRTAAIGDTTVRINGFAKGSGMIEPDMATMLAFVFTDAAISGQVLQDLLAEGNQDSFNSITVDSDTSTSDTCLLFASGAAGNAEPVSASDTRLAGFREALGALMQDLAVQVVRDGEGAEKLIEVVVRGAATDAEARVAAKAIANSPLVKTAVAGEDANWGRVVMAVGKSGARLDQRNLGVSFGGITIASGGGKVEDYDESLVTGHLKGREILIEVELGAGTGTARVWTCDLTHGYIEINADYRS